ncbi:Long-chain-fatty-acid--CoA ligase [compost metagenome]
MVVRKDASITAQELIAHAKARLGSYKAPKTLIFVDELPTSVVGKVLRRQVREKYWLGTARKIS